MLRRLLILLIVAFWMQGCSNSGSDQKSDENKVPVKVATIMLGQVVQSLNYIGDIEAEYEVKVFSKIPDRIVKFYVDEGSRVGKGDPIAEIHATTIEQAVRQAEAALAATQAQAANAQIEMDRANRLYLENAMSKQQFDAITVQYEAAKAGLEQAQALMTSAKSQFTDATIEAPISGIIGKRYYEEGDMANPGMPLVTIVQMERVKIAFNTTEIDLGQLAVGKRALVRVKSYGDKAFEGKITKISPVLDPMTRMARAEIVIGNPNYLLKPGMFARVEVIAGVLENIISIPRFATIENTSLERIAGQDEIVRNYYVFVAKDGLAEQRKLEVEYVNHVNIAVRSGVSVGEQIVIEGQNNLRDQIPISVIEEESL